MRVVVDCNVLVSAARSGGVCGRVVIEVTRNREVVLSEAVVDEYEAITRRSAHARYRDGLRAIIAEFERIAVWSSQRISHLVSVTLTTKSTWRLRRPAARS